MSPLRLSAIGMLIGALLPLLSDAAEEQQSISVLFLGGDAGSHEPAERLKCLIPVLGSRGIDFTFTEDLDMLKLEKLRRFDCLLIYAYRAELTAQQEKGLLDYVDGGGGFLAIHCASACFRESKPYIELVGAQFKRHDHGVFRTEIVDAEHPIMKGFQGFETWDETYVHHMHNERHRTVLQRRREGNGYEPWTWVRTHGKGRVFYTAYGHDQRAWSNPGFHTLIERAIHWAAGSDQVVANLYQELPADVKPVP